MLGLAFPLEPTIVPRDGAAMQQETPEMGGQGSRAILEAIALQRCIDAVYNRSRVRLAPHILYTRHGEPFVDAVTIDREGRPVLVRRLGTFKLSGLRVEGVTPVPFAADPEFDAAAARYEGVTLFTIAGGGTGG